MTSILFNPIKLNNSLTLNNAIVMAPLTRCFADKNLVPTQKMADYYAKRAGVGLIVSEATLIDPLAQGYPNTPGIYTSEQIEGWKKVTQAVHDRGGKIFCQLWHCGRIAHSFYTNEKPLAPSARKWKGRVPRSDNLVYEKPRSLSTKEVKKIIKKYISAAKNAIKAGFDGVEIHGANGYLVDQFIRKETNKRTDLYGGSKKKRAKFALKIVDGIVEAIGADNTAIRLSPQAYAYNKYKKGDEKTYKYLFKKFDQLKIAFVHLGAFSDEYTFEYLDNLKASAFIRKYFKGNFISCGSYTINSAIEAIENKQANLVAIGRPLIANPDFIERVKNGKSLIEYDAKMLTELI